MEAIRLNKVVERDGELFVTGLPCKKGQYVEMIVLRHPHLTARQIIHSGLIGLWRDREDIEDSGAYARQLREQAQRWRGPR